MKKILLVMMSWVLCSCASMRYGNLTNTSASKDEYLARDAFMRIAKIKVPARTTFRVHQKTDSVFGHQLIELLRQNGYGVQEHLTSNKQANFYYVVDKLAADKRIRVSIFMDSEELSRAYGIYNGRLMPLGVWSHKE